LVKKTVKVKFSEHKTSSIKDEKVMFQE